MAADEATEEWRPVTGAPYEVSSLGRMRRTGRAKGARVGRDVKGWIAKTTGYVMVNFPPRPGKRAPIIELHRLICETFHGPAPSPRHEVRHRDGVKLNLRADNLEWGTRRENMHDKWRHGTMRSGERAGQAKLTDAQVRDLRREHQAAMVGRKHNAPYGWLDRMAERYGVGKKHIIRITKGRAWVRLDANS